MELADYQPIIGALSPPLELSGVSWCQSSSRLPCGVPHVGRRVAARTPRRERRLHLVPARARARAQERDGRPLGRASPGREARWRGLARRSPSRTTSSAAGTSCASATGCGKQSGSSRPASTRTGSGVSAAAALRNVGVTVDVVRVEKWDSLSVRRDRMAPQFRGLPVDDLLVSGFDVRPSPGLNRPGRAPSSPPRRVPRTSPSARSPCTPRFLRARRDP